MTGYYPSVNIKNNLTLKGTATLGSATLPYYGTMYFVGSQTLSGTGSVLFNNGASNSLYVNTASTALTIGPSITIHGKSGNVDGLNNTTIINQGKIVSDGGGTLQIQPSGGTFTNQGTALAAGSLTPSGVTIPATEGAAFATAVATFTATRSTVAVDSPTFVVNASAILASPPDSTITIKYNLVGNTTNAAGFAPQGNIVFNGSGTSAAPQLLEAMSDDLGAVDAGFTANFDYGSLSLANNTYLKLVDLSDNSAGARDGRHVLAARHQRRYRHLSIDGRRRRFVCLRRRGRRGFADQRHVFHFVV